MHNSHTIHKCRTFPTWKIPIYGDVAYRVQNNVRRLAVFCTKNCGNWSKIRTSSGKSRVFVIIKDSTKRRVKMITILLQKTLESCHKFSLICLRSRSAILIRNLIQSRGSSVRWWWQVGKRWRDRSQVQCLQQIQDKNRELQKLQW